jgi:hypothetical protein
VLLFEEFGAGGIEVEEVELQDEHVVEGVSPVSSALLYSYVAAQYVQHQQEFGLPRGLPCESVEEMGVEVEAAVAVGLEVEAGFVVLGCPEKILDPDWHAL